MLWFVTIDFWLMLRLILSDVCCDLLRLIIGWCWYSGCAEIRNSDSRAWGKKFLMVDTHFKKCLGFFLHQKSFLFHEFALAMVVSLLCWLSRFHLVNIRGATDLLEQMGFLGHVGHWESGSCVLEASLTWEHYTSTVGGLSQKVS